MSRPINTIVLVPFAINEILREGSVVTTTKASPVIINGDEVVDLLLAFLRFDDSCCEVKVIDWEVHKDVEFVPTGAARTEALEMHDENIRCLPQLKLFRGSLVLLTPGAVPCVSF